MWLNFHLKKEQTITRAVTKVVNEKLYWEVIFKELIT